ncbi:LCP family protein [Demequina sp. B12]|uniref:LCP family protein n=1 Tax=Demequina sp. B12 TaxID=2992757 RepID=UPI00237A8E17|nr:LCP family protein [Demequina sp. B12]MDE0572915.1 LCP family protein [Demequina sp. B12]
MPPRPRPDQPARDQYARSSQPAASAVPHNAAPVEPAQPTQPPRKRKHGCCRVLWVLLALIVVAVVWFLVWVNSNITTVDALSGAPDTPGETYLIVGSDSRDGWSTTDPTEGARTDTIMVLHKPESGPTALISLPRDSYVEIPGYGANKVNAAFTFGGPQLLVETVEDLSGLTIDHYMEIGFTGVEDIVDAVGGVELCYDEDVSDEKSQLEWEAGCHVVDGETALAFSRMRYSDPLGDIGRAQRQRQVVSAVAEEMLSPGTVFNPFHLVPVASATLDAFRVDTETGVFDLAQFALVLNSAMSDGAVTGTPPITSLGYNVAGVGSTVLLDPDRIDQFWIDIADGNYEPGTDVGGVA